MNRIIGTISVWEDIIVLFCQWIVLEEDGGDRVVDKLEKKWGEQYPIVIKSWRDNWNRLSEFFQYSEPIRKLIYTTNTVEGYHRQIRKVTKN